MSPEAVGNWWLRSPNTGNANNPRNVNTAGQVNNNNAYNANGLAPDCEKCQIGVSEKTPKPEHSRKELLSCSGEPDENMHADADVSRDISAIDSVQQIVCSFDSLYWAAHICKHNVMWKASVAGYIKNILINTLKLRTELIDGSYSISKYSIFIIHEKKTRIIVATRMRDRVFQRSLCDNYLYAAMTRSFIYDNAACQIGKGTDFARKRLTEHLRKFYRKYKADGYVLKIDIHDFFGSTPHDVAKAAVAKRVKNEWARQHVFDIIDSFNHIGGERGLGLGSQITQLVELSVLDDLDHYIKERLRIKYYVRYNDDMLLIHHDKEYLKECKDIIVNKIKDLGLETNENKTFIQRIDKNIKFLGFSFRVTESGRVLQTILRKNVNKEKRKLKRQAEIVKRGNMTPEHFRECYEAWRNHASKGRNKATLENMNKYFEKIYKEVERYVQIQTIKRAG